MESAAQTRLLVALHGALQQRDRASVNAAAESLIVAKARLDKQWKAIVTVLIHNGELRLADRASRQWLAEDAESTAARFERVAFLARSGRGADALTLLDDVPSSFPSPAECAYLRGTISANLGLAEDARAALRHATRSAPRSGQAWLALAMVGEVEAGDAKELEDASSAISTAPAIERSAWLYALGKVQSDRGQPEKAFEAIDQGAALVRPMRRYDRVSDQSAAQQAIDGWSSPVALSEPTAGGCQPIFVTGLPRSGTTLVEQILTSHTEVIGGEELSAGRIVVEEVGGLSRFDLEKYLQERGSVNSLRQLYLHLLYERFLTKGRVIDKSLNTSRYLGVLATLFPDAPVIWVRRDPLDCAWSAYRHWFVKGLDWSWSLEDIAFHFALEDALLTKWKAILGDQILVVDYSRLVAQPQAGIEEITRHCKLSFEAQLLRPELNDRIVTTNSAAQVRRPIHQEGVGSAAAIADLLKPFVEAYAKARRDLGFQF